MKKKENRIKGIKMAVTGLLVIAAVNALTGGLHVYKTIVLAEAAAIAVMLVAWVIVFMGVKTAGRLKKEFHDAYIIAGVSLAAVLAQGGLAAKYVLIDKMGTQAFIDFFVLLMYYISILGMIFTYRLLLKGTNEMVLDSSGRKKYISWEKPWRRGAVSIMACLLLLPLAALLPEIAKIIASAAIIIFAFFIQLYMCGFIRQGYDFLEEKGIRT